MQNEEVTAQQYIKVRFSGRDFEHLSDCDDMVQELISDFHPMEVELTFFHTDAVYDSILRRLSDPNESGWGDDVHVIADEEAKEDTFSVAMSHDRSGARSPSSTALRCF